MLWNKSWYNKQQPQVNLFVLLTSLVIFVCCSSGGIASDAELICQDAKLWAKHNQKAGKCVPMNDAILHTPYVAEGARNQLEDVLESLRLYCSHVYNDKNNDKRNDGFTVSCSDGAEQLNLKIHNFSDDLLEDFMSSIFADCNFLTYSVEVYKLDRRYYPELKTLLKQMLEARSLEGSGEFINICTYIQADQLSAQYEKSLRLMSDYCFSMFIFFCLSVALYVAGYCIMDIKSVRVHPSLERYKERPLNSNVKR